MNALKRLIRVLVVDDHAPFRDFVRSALQKRPDLQIIDEVADGIRAVQKAHELHPELILLDIGLPMLNGIEAGRRIRQLSPTSKILFVTENRSREVAEEVVRSGFGGYVAKSDAASDLLPAVESVLQGKQFVSTSLAGLRGVVANQSVNTGLCVPGTVSASSRPAPALRITWNCGARASCATPPSLRSPRGYP
jgi:DNA-binding NarL/FixJ family response regulator